MNIIAELAGADSLAAIIKYLKENPTHKIIPTWVVTPYEKKENFITVKSNYLALIDYLKEKNYQIEDLVILNNDNELWDSLQNQTFFSPCIACHLYCHLLRIPLAKNYNAKILTGERKSHNGRIKVNQNDFVLNWFNDFFLNHNYIFERPLINIQNTDEITALLNSLPFDTEDKNNFIACSITSKKNLKECDLDYKMIEEYLEKILKPIMEEKYV